MYNTQGLSRLSCLISVKRYACKYPFFSVSRPFFELLLVKWPLNPDQPLGKFASLLIKSKLLILTYVAANLFY